MNKHFIANLQRKVSDKALAQEPELSTPLKKHQEKLYDGARSRVMDVKNQIDELLNKFPNKLQTAVEDHSALLKNQYNPKLEHAQEKIDNLAIMADKQRNETGSHASLKKLDEQNEHYGKTRDQFDRQRTEYAEMRDDYRNRCKDLESQIARIKAELMGVNRLNLKKIYELEDLIEQIEAIKGATEVFNLTYTVKNKEKSLASQMSYASLEEKQGQKKAHNLLQGKIEKVLEEEELIGSEEEEDDGLQRTPVKKSGKVTFQNGKSKAPEVQSKVKSNVCHPDVDFSKLNATQRTEVESWIYKIKRLNKEGRQLRAAAHKHTMAINSEYTHSCKVQELSEFYDDCMKVCSKEIIHIHQANQPDKIDQNSHSYILEILRQQKQQENEKKNLGVQEDLVSGHKYCTIDRHTQSMIYKTVRQIGSNAREEQKKVNMMQMEIGWKEFQMFSPLQVLGLTLLRSDCNEKLKKILFHPFSNSM